MTPAGALGAASVIVDVAGRVLLVHHTYGMLNWELPGGGSESGESAEATAIREAREELGCTIADLRLTGVYWEPGWGDGAGLHHFVFRATLTPGAEPYAADPHEISELGWFAVDTLPRPVSDFTVRRIEDALSGRPAAVHTIAGRNWVG